MHRTVKTFVVDALEVTARPGCVVLRGGELTTRPGVLALPVGSAAQLVSQVLPEAIAFAEEDYWPLIRALKHQSDDRVIDVATRRYLEGVDWDSLVGPLSDELIAVIHEEGHVGVYTEPPFSVMRTKESSTRCCKRPGCRAHHRAWPRLKLPP